MRGIWYAVATVTGAVIGIEESGPVGLFIGGALFGIGCLMVRLSDHLGR